MICSNSYNAGDIVPTVTSAPMVAQAFKRMNNPFLLELFVQSVCSDIKTNKRFPPYLMPQICCSNNKNNKHENNCCKYGATHKPLSEHVSSPKKWKETHPFSKEASRINLATTPNILIPTCWEEWKGRHSFSEELSRANWINGRRPKDRQRNYKKNTGGTLSVTKK